MTLGHSSIYERIRDFNKMFGLPHPGVPTLGKKDELRARLVRFHEILQKEMKEHEDILAAIDQNKDPLEVAVMLSDWYMDIVVYCLSEACRVGIPSELVLHAIMDSQRSKLGADGKPIVANGKVQKGPNYVAPEPMIQSILSMIIHANTWERRA